MTDPPKGSSCLHGPLTLLPVSCRPPCFNLNPSFLIKHPSINYLQYMQMSIGLAGAWVTHTREVGFYGGKMTWRKTKNSASWHRGWGWPREDVQQPGCRECWEAVGMGDWETETTLARESVVSSLTLCCAVGCVTLSRYLNVSELQSPHPWNGDYSRNVFIRVLGKLQRNNK